MEETQWLDAVERYLHDEMNPQEKAEFEQLRKSNAELDQLVVEHSIFLNKFEKFAENKTLRSSLREIQQHLLQSGVIKEKISQPVVAEWWKKYKRVMAVAASIAGLTTLLIATMVVYYSRKANHEDLAQLRREFKREVAQKTNEVRNELKAKTSKAPDNIPIKSGGTGFLIDGKGYLVTNAHVVKGSSSVVVQNNKAQEFRSTIIYLNPVTDIALLKIEDPDFKPLAVLPYTIRQSGAELGEALFTLGYPRDEIVYNEGYMSAKTGFNGDTMTCQIGVSANPGNSGGPVFNKNGEVIGIINTRQVQAEGVVFAITAKYIFISLDEIKNDTSVQNVKLATTSSLKGLDRVQQVRKIEDCVFMVKSY